MYYYAEVKLNGITTVKRIPVPDKILDFVERNGYIRKYLSDLGYTDIQIISVH